MTFTRNVVTGSRSLGTVYQNTTSNAMFVGVTVGGSRTGTAHVAVDPTSPPGSWLSAYGTDTGLNRYMFVVVRPSEYYVADVDSGGGVNLWTEWTTDISVTRVDRTSSYVFGTAYQNTSGVPQIVTAWGWHDNTSNYLLAYVGPTSSPAPSTLVGSGHGIFSVNLSFIVLPNQWYRIVDVNATCNMGAWTEWPMTGAGTLYLNDQTGLHLTNPNGNTGYGVTPVSPAYVAPGAMFICPNITETTAPFSHNLAVASDTSANPSTYVAVQNAIDFVADYSCFVPIVSGEGYGVQINDNNTVHKWMEWSPVRLAPAAPIMEFSFPS